MLTCRAGNHSVVQDAHSSGWTSTDANIIFIYLADRFSQVLHDCTRHCSFSHEFGNLFKCQSSGVARNACICVCGHCYTVCASPDTCCLVRLDTARGGKGSHLSSTSIAGTVHVCDQNCQQRVQVDPHTSVCRLSRKTFDTPVEQV